MSLKINTYVKNIFKCYNNITNLLQQYDILVKRIKLWSKLLNYIFSYSKMEI